MRRSPLLPLYLSTGFCLSLSLSLLATNDAFRHPFLIPVTLCGILIGVDATRWLLREIDVFDPAGVLGMVGVHFFFVAPILHVQWSYWMSPDYWVATIPPPRDWRPYLEDLAWLNAIGLSLYMAASRLGRPRPARRIWHAEPSRMVPILIGGLAITLVAQIFVFIRVGGLSGLVDIVSTDLSQLGGFGWAFMIAEAFPILAIMLFALIARRSPKLQSWPVLILALLAFFILKLLFGGLRGSRSNTVWGLFWAAGVIHLWIRPIPRWLILSALPLLFVFMYVYGFYKAAGRDALRAFDSSEARAELEAETGRTTEMILLQDLGRTDVQAFILYVQDQRMSRVEEAGGRTYLGAAALMIPAAIWPDRPPGKVKEGTELFYGPTAYASGHTVSKVYGLTGEALLNFGPYGVPPAFLLLGLLVRKARRAIASLHEGDARLLLVPFLVNLTFVVLTADSDNIIVFLMKMGAVPVLAVYLGSSIRRVEPTG